MRCGISNELSKSQIARVNSAYENVPIDQLYRQFSSPWTIFIDTCQILLLLDLIDDAQNTIVAPSSNASVGTDMNSIVTFDEFTDTQVKVTACEALHVIVRRANDSPSDYQTVQVAIQELCKSDVLIPRLEGMLRLTSTAAVLISDIRLLSDLRFEDNLEEMGFLLEKQLRSRSVVQRQQGITLLATYFRKHPTDRNTVIPTLPIALIKKAINSSTRFCLIKSFQRARSSFMADLPSVVELIMSIIEVHNVLALELMKISDEEECNSDDEDSRSSGDRRDDAGIQKYLGYSPDTLDYVLKSLFDALTVLSGHENSALVLVKCRHLTEGLLETLKIQFDYIHSHRDAGNGRSSPSQFLEDEEVEQFELELVLINSILDIFLHLSNFAEEVLTQRLLLPCAVATGDDENGLEMLLTYSVDVVSAPILTYRPDGPRNVKFTLKSFTMRPIEASLAELLFFLLYNLSCGGTLSTAAVYITHSIFLCELANHLGNDIDNWLSLVPHLLETKDREPVATPDDILDRLQNMQSFSGDGDGPTRTSDKPTQSMEAYVADILCAKLGMLTNLCRVSTGRDRIFSMQKELQALLQLIIMYVELPDVKLIYACTMLLTSLVPMVYQSDLKDKVVNKFVESTVVACFNAAGRVDDLIVIDKVKKMSCLFLLFSFH